MTDHRKKRSCMVLLPLPFRLLIGGCCIVLATVMLSVSFLAMLALYDPDVYLEQFYQFMMEPDLSFFMYSAFNTVSLALGMTFTIVQMGLLLVFLMASASWLMTGDFWSGPAKCLNDACKETAQCACELWEEASAALLYSRGGDLEMYGSLDEEEEQENENEDDGKENGGEDIEMGECIEENENKRRGEEEKEGDTSQSSLTSPKSQPSKVKGEGQGRRRKRKVKRSNSEESMDLMHEWTLLSEKSDNEKETEIPEGEQKEKKEEKERREISAKNKEEPLEDKEEVEEMPRREKLPMEKEKRTSGSGETLSEAIGRQ